MRIFPARAHYLHMPSTRPTEDPQVRTRQAQALLQEIATFVTSCAAPALLEPGEEILPLREGEYSLECDGEGVLLECWGEARTLRRRLRAIRKRARNCVELDAERFPRRRCTLSLLDIKAETAAQFEKESTRSVAREELRRWCERFHPGWRIECLSSAPDLQHSLSPRFPRALLRMGSEGVCAIAAPDVPGAEDVFTFGLIWLQHCRDRWRDLHVRTLLLFAPEAAASALALRLVACNHAKLRYRLVLVSAEGALRELSPRAWGNLGTQFSLAGGVPANEQARHLFQEVASGADAECVEDLRGALSLEVRGLPIARAEGDELRVGLKLRHTDRWPSAESLHRLARRVARVRCAQSADANHSLYRLFPERWLESVVRQQIRAIDPTLHPSLVRRQVSGSLGMHRTRTDLLALDESGRLVVIEVKAEADIQLPVQAIDYYSRLKLHLERGDLHAAGVFSGATVRTEPPRVLLVAPALCFHPSNETVLQFLESSIQVRQVGVAIEWRKQLRVVFQHSLAGAATGGSARWPAIFSSKSEKPSRR
ncbi:MAG: hypothetical protein KIT83_08760 [Bryobacterales bacterium]|nr:hypothetical protein [Bryobacterales bacterium]